MAAAAAVAARGECRCAESSQDVVRDVYRNHAVTFFDELRSWFTKETRSLRREAEKQLEVDQLKCLRERVEQLEANTVIHMPTSAGDAAAGGGAGTSPRSISPTRHAISGLDASTMRSLCCEEARRALEELRGELLGGDLLCDELLRGGDGLRPALERLMAKVPTRRFDSDLSSEVAELRASVDGAAAAATAAATAEIGRLDGAFRSSLAAEVRDLGSLCEGVRNRIEALDQSAAEHIGRLGARLDELEVQAQPLADTCHRALEQVCSGVGDPMACGDVLTGDKRYEGRRHTCGDLYEGSASNAKLDQLAFQEGQAGQTSSLSSTSIPSMPKMRDQFPGGGVHQRHSRTPRHDVPRDRSQEMANNQSLNGRVDAACEDALGRSFRQHDRTFERELPGEVLFVPPTRLQPQTASSSHGLMQPGTLPASVSTSSSVQAACGIGAGPGKGEPLRSPSTPPKRHVPPGVASWSSPNAGGGGCNAGGSSAAAGSGAFSSRRSSKGGGRMNEWTGISPQRLEVRGGC